MNVPEKREFIHSDTFTPPAQRCLFAHTLRGTGLKALHPLQNHLVEPEARGAPGDETHVATMSGGDEMNVRVAPHGGLFVEADGNERVVGRMDHQHGNPYLPQEILRGLGGVIMSRIPEAAQRGHVGIVEAPDGVNPVDAFEREKRGHQGVLAPQGLLHADDELLLVEPVPARLDAAGALRQVDRRGYGAGPGEQSARGPPQFPGQLRRLVAAQRVAHQEERQRVPRP